MADPKPTKDADEPAEPEDGPRTPGEEQATEPPPAYGLNDRILGDQKFMVADSDITGEFGQRTLDGLQQGRTRWAARFSGEGLDGPSADPIITSRLLRRLAITARWMANGMFPGHRGVPGFVFGQAAHSVVLEFALAPDEKPVRLTPADRGEGDEMERDVALEKETVYPSVEGGRYMATLLASADDADQLVERLGLVTRQAVLTYQGALKEFVEFDADLDLLVPVAVAEPTDTGLRRVHVPPEQSKKGLETLNRVPEETRTTFEVEGLLYTQNSLSNEFGIQLDNGDHATGEYDIRVADKLGPAWDKRVWARIEEIGPKQDWMPRAGRIRRTLIDVERLRKGQTRLS
jgi:hypothetical protein